MASAIRLENVAKTLRGHRALDGISFRVEPGSLTGLVGLNGAGKTTTLRVLLGLLAADSGTSEVLGVPSASIARLGRRVGAQLHGGGLDPSLTVTQTLRYTATLHGIARADVDGMIRRVDLAHLSNRRVSKLSAGERQRLALARALLLSPDVLVLDEPLTHLDPGAAERVIELLLAEAERGAAVLLSSHQLEFLDRAADHVVFVHRGRVLAAGSPHELIAAEGATYEVEAEPESIAASKIAAFSGLLAQERVAGNGAGPSTWRVTVEPQSAADLNAGLVGAGCRVSAFAPQRRSLHDFFLERVRAMDREASR